MKQKIIDFLRRNGPSHPVQIGKILGKDGLMTSAILSEVIKDGSVKKTERNVGNTPLYFVSGQEEATRTMVMNDLGLVEKKVVEKIKSSSFIFHSDLSTQDKFVLPGLKDFIVPLKVKLGENEAIIWKFHDISNDRILPAITDRLKKFEKAPVKREDPKTEVPEKIDDSIFERKTEEKKETMDIVPSEKLGAFQDKVEMWFSRNDIEIVSSDIKRKGKEMEYVIAFKSPISQKYFVKCKDKKRISESDLSLTYTEAMQKKMPAIFLTSGKVSKKTMGTIQKKFGGLIKIVEI